MVNLLYELSNVMLLIGLSAFFITFSIAVVLLLRLCTNPAILYKDNPVLGSISSLIGIIYGVLAGLTALYLINNISYTSDAILREANSVSNIYRDSIWFKEPMRQQMRQQTADYLQAVINVEWPLMKEGKRVNYEDNKMIMQMTNSLINYSKNMQPTDLLLVRDALEEVKSLYNARETRLHMSHYSLNSEIWVVIIIGTFLTLGINYLFGMNLYLHIFAVTVASIMAAAIIFLLVSLDRPFQGEFGIQPNAFKAVLNIVQTDAYAIEKPA